MINVLLGIQHQTFLGQLQLMDKEHQDDAQNQGDEGGVKCQAQAFSYTGDITFYRLMGLAQCVANPTNGADKANEGIAQEI